MTKIFDIRPGNLLLQASLIPVLCLLGIFLILLKGNNDFNIVMYVLYFSMVIIVSIYILNRKVILYENGIKIVVFFKRSYIEYENIKSLCVEKYRVNIPKTLSDAICFYSVDKKKIPFPYKEYSKNDVNKILKFVNEKNDKIEMCFIVKELIRH